MNLLGWQVVFLLVILVWIFRFVVIFCCDFAGVAGGAAVVLLMVVMAACEIGVGLMI